MWPFYYGISFRKHSTIRKNEKGQVKKMIIKYDNGDAFLKENREYLLTNKYLADFFLIDAPLLQNCDRENYAVACVQGDKKLLVLKVEPYNPLLFGDKEPVKELISFLLDNGLQFHAVLCEMAVGEEVVRVSEKRGIKFELTIGMDFMETDEYTEPSSDEVIRAEETDLDEILECHRRFIIDCGLTDETVRETVRKHLPFIRVLKKDGRIASMAQYSMTDDSARISFVYTRDEYRGRGLARKVVNSIKNEILESGRKATLNVDRKNPVSNHLYASLGFKKVFSQGIFAEKAE